jgi:serine/threonine protein kinase
MPLQSGSKLGQYEILAAIGAGVQGEVYKAKDTRLDRTVAIKVLPSHIASNPQVRQRFEREARAVSSLNHPHICTLHDIGQEDGVDFLVMEHIEGESLADRLNKGPLPFDQALKHAIEIADALDNAHRQGVVHRDLKPGNIMLTKAGAKLLDFGLAKFRETGEGEGASSTALPTQQKPLTEQGSILGTFQYMAPEQLEGKDVDNRTDVFAFGVTLYEMLAGKRPFEGKSAASLIAAIIEREPRPLKEINAATPPALSQLIEGCLAKDPEDRWQSMADVTRQLRWISTGPNGDTIPKQTEKRRILPYTLLTAAAVVLAALVGLWIGRSDEVPSSPSRFVIPFPAGGQPSVGASVALSPDGEFLVYAATRNGTSRLFLRPLDRLDATPIPGSEGAESPFFSPDGKWVAFFTADGLKKVNVEGGAPVVLADVMNTVGVSGSWSPLGEILFSPGIGSGLLRVSDTGGVPEALTSLQGAEARHGTPHILPDNKHVLFTVGIGGQSVRVALLSLETREWKALDLGNVPHATFVPPGHLVFARAGGLYAAPFDVGKLELTGAPSPVLADVFIDVALGSAQYSVSNNGTLAFVPSRAENRLVWVNRQGDSRPLMEEPRAYITPRLSPDGRRLAVVVRDVNSGRRDIWVRDLARGTFTRLTQPNLEFAHEPAWSPDGTQIAFAGRKLGSDLDRNVFVAHVDGTAEPRRLTANAEPTIPSSWSPDGKLIFFNQLARDVGFLRVDEPESDKMLVESPFNEFEATLSPNGRWLAYTSNESGRFEVYVTDFPALARRWQVSVEGGKEPLWGANGLELFCRAGDRMMVVQVADGTDFTPSKPATLFEGPYAVDPVGQDAVNYDVTADGKEFVMIEEDRLAPGVVVVLNWVEELKRLAPTN